MLKRLFALFFALALLTGLAACGDDDDEGGDDASAEETDSGDEAADEEASDEEPTDEGGDSDLGPAATAYCEDFSEEEGEQPIDELESELEAAAAAQEEIADQEVVDAIQGVIDLGRHLIDNDDGDGVITAAEAQAALPEFPDAPAQLQTVTTFCGG